MPSRPVLDGAWADGGAKKTDLDAGKRAVSAALQIAAA
jgi:hypothetical protein